MISPVAFAGGWAFKYSSPLGPPVMPRASIVSICTSSMPDVRFSAKQRKLRRSKAFHHQKGRHGTLHQIVALQHRPDDIQIGLSPEFISNVCSARRSGYHRQTSGRVSCDVKGLNPVAEIVVVTRQPEMRFWLHIVNRRHSKPELFTGRCRSIGPADRNAEEEGEQQSDSRSMKMASGLVRSMHDGLSGNWPAMRLGQHFVAEIGAGHV